MAKQLVNTGSTANDGTGDTLRVAFNKVNNNTNELYMLSERASSLEINTDNDFTSTPNVLNFSSQFTASDLLSDGTITSLKIENGLLSTLEYDPPDGNLITAYGNAQEALDLCLRQSSIKNWNINETETLTKDLASVLWVKNETGYSIDLIAPSDAFVGLNYKIINNITSTENFRFRNSNNTITLGVITPGNFIEFQYTNENSWLIVDTSSSFIPGLIPNSGLANMPSATLKGRFSSGGGSPQDISIGSGLNLDSSTGVLTTVPNLIVWDTINFSPFNSLVNKYYLVNTDISTINVSLPTAVGNNGVEITFKKINVNTNNAVISALPGQTIDGAPSKSLIFQWDVLTVRSNGSNWLVLTEFPTRVVVKPIHNFTRTGSTQSFNAGTLTTVIFNNNVGDSGLSNVSLNTSNGTFTFSKVGNYSMSGVLDMTSATANARGLLQLVSSGAGINGYLFSSIQLCSTANTSSPIHFTINFNISTVGDLLLRLTMGAAATLNNISGTGGNTIISRLTITELA